MDTQLVKLETRAAKSERRIKSLEKSLKTLAVDPASPTEDIHKYPGDIHKYPEDMVLETPEGYFCGFCKTAKLAKKGIQYSKTLKKTFQKYRCSKCGAWFKIDENGIEIPTKRKKRLKQRNA